MTAIKWDQQGDRRYETGLDRGVVYLRSGGALPWNGLKSVTEDTNREVKSYYTDGIKYLDAFVPGSFSATLEALTYPEELDTLLGLSEFAPGVFLHDQNAGQFNLSYRTLIGDDVVGTGRGYKLHILYNVMASPQGHAVSSLSATSDVNPFTWTLTGTPDQLFGARPTSHISIDSTLVDAATLEFIENTIYGTGVSDPSLPSLIDLVGLVVP